MTRRLLAALVLAVALIGGACSGDDDGGSSATSAAGAGEPLRVDAMPAAVDALEAELGGAQRYFEVNATPTLVNLFVAGPDGASVTPYIYDAVSGTLTEPDPTQSATGSTFSWSQVDFDPSTVLSEALDELPNALPRTFAVTAADESALQYLVTVESSQGGVLDVLVDRDGTVLGAQAR